MIEKIIDIFTKIFNGKAMLIDHLQKDLERERMISENLRKQLAKKSPVQLKSRGGKKS